ncbi:helix-turn-helix transcriptional regulator [Sphingomonas sp. JC676]|uniref:helix-turn-helix transcriptional regulator n=1 Tax=Sphingomonas sp. JC676 TaxID=2768065 RepID=UPI001657B808|nr:helix-turn-helix transcriptional regulator [Sphingomonas sp. JC676]MBC9033733.1 helix-turn-helix transcriptional regulator [Sphingomonas sp. JC676]
MNGLTLEAALAETIGAIGTPDFVPRVAQALCRFSDFEHAAAFLHRPRDGGEVLSDDFSRIGYRTGIENYARRTYRINPMLAAWRGAGAMRARDFASATPRIDRTILPFLVRAPEEELGYRTLGWPERQEEVCLYFKGWDGLIELGFYRERARRAAPERMIAALNTLGAPIAAAFERHLALYGAAQWRAPLTGRELEVCELLLQGCSSDTIALRLAISRHTVKDHRKQIFRKLGAGSLAELFALARCPPLWRDGARSASA